MILHEKLSDITPNVFICLPLVNLDETYFNLIKEYRFNLEIGFDFRALDIFNLDYFKNTAKRLLDLVDGITIHAPFHELFPGAPDKNIRNAAVSRLDAAFAAAKFFSPKSVVMHLNYEERRFRFVYDEWYRNAIVNLKRYAEMCGEMGAFLSVENVFEETPAAMKEVFSDLKGYPVYHCLDVGHLNCFSNTSLDLWLAELGPFIRQFHLHDNDGKSDTHSPIGTGNIDLDIIRKFISQSNPKPLITLEPHSLEDLWKTLEGFHNAGFPEALKI